MLLFFILFVYVAATLGGIDYVFMLRHRITHVLDSFEVLRYDVYVVFCIDWSS